MSMQSEWGTQVAFRKVAAETEAAIVALGFTRQIPTPPSNSGWKVMAFGSKSGPEIAGFGMKFIESGVDVAVILNSTRKDFANKFCLADPQSFERVTHGPAIP